MIEKIAGTAVVILLFSVGFANLMPKDVEIFENKGGMLMAKIIIGAFFGSVGVLLCCAIAAIWVA